MQKRTLGNIGLEVSAIGRGCLGISQPYGLPMATRRKPVFVARLERQGYT